jgi:hypothetical protein
MATQGTRIRIFVASPGDVQEERKSLSEVINELNFTLAALMPEKGTVLELVKWETHAYPSAGRPQGKINEQIGSYDIFIGIMWKRFGTDTGVAESGTTEEFNNAFDRWKRTGQPHVMFYFCQKPVPLAMGNADLEQLQKVIKFRSMLSTQGLIWDYPDHQNLKDIIRPHLIGVLGRMLSHRTPIDVAEGISALSPDTSAIKRQIDELANKYRNLRAGMPSGPERTREMEVVMTSMRTLAPLAYPLLDDLSKSDEPGKRLAAIAILQALPKAEYLSWLVDRLQQDREKPFVGYHAAVALLTAARSLPEHRDALCAEISRAKAFLIPNLIKSDRYRTLEDAGEQLISE